MGVNFSKSNREEIEILKVKIKILNNNKKSPVNLEISVIEKIHVHMIILICLLRRILINNK